MTRSIVPKKPRPNFLYVGAGKAASHWMCEIFREHPEIFVADAKDLMFFDRYYGRGLDWYLSHFSQANGQRAIGEFSHDYFLEEEYAERIVRDFPDVKILVCLREPVDRTFSEYLYDQTLFQFVPAEEYESGLGFEGFARLPRIRQRSNYAVNLRYFYDRFPRERILVEFYEDLRADPGRFARRVFQFLEVDPEFNPPSLHRRINPARQARSPRIARFAYQIGQLLRRSGMPKFVGAFKRHSWLGWILYREFGRGMKKPAIPEDVRRRLHELYRGQDAALSRLIGRPLPRSWTRPAEPLFPAITSHVFAEAPVESM
jgi:hypothetical protein